MLWGYEECQADEKSNSQLQGGACGGAKTCRLLDQREAARFSGSPQVLSCNLPGQMDLFCFAAALTVRLCSDGDRLYVDEFPQPKHPQFPPVA